MCSEIDKVIEKFKCLGWTFEIKEFTDRHKNYDRKFVQTVSHDGVSIYLGEYSEITEDLINERYVYFKKLDDLMKLNRDTVQFPVKVSRITYSGGSCPYTIDGETEDGEYFHLRYRNGRLRVGTYHSEKTFSSAKFNIISKVIGERYDGQADVELFEKYLHDRVIFPDGFKIGDCVDDKYTWP